MMNKSYYKSGLPVMKELNLKKFFCRKQQPRILLIIGYLLPVLGLIQLVLAGIVNNQTLLSEAADEEHQSSPHNHEEPAVFFDDIINTNQNSDKNLLVITIGNSSEVDCQPGIAANSYISNINYTSTNTTNNNTEWCIDPVVGQEGLCSFTNNSWEELQAVVHPHLDGEGAEMYQEQFEEKGRVGTQQDEAKMNGCYAAHLAALQSLCQRREEQLQLQSQSTSEEKQQEQQFSFGLVLESDILSSSFLIYDGNFPNWNFGSFVVKLMASDPDTTVFNLGVSTAICSSSSLTRMQALKRGQCVLPWVMKQWGTPAVGYNLTTACSPSFMEIQETLLGCVPSDLGLYSGAGGFQARMSVLPLFQVQLDGTGMNAQDSLHTNLGRVYAEVKELWQYLFSHGVNCITATTNTSIQMLDKDWKWKCIRDSGIGGYYSRLQKRSRLALWWRNLFYDEKNVIQ